MELSRALTEWLVYKKALGNDDYQLQNGKYRLTEEAGARVERGEAAAEALSSVGEQIGLKESPMNAFVEGNSILTRMRNWNALSRAFELLGINLDEDSISIISAGDHEAIEATMYELLRAIDPEWEEQYVEEEDDNGSLESLLTRITERTIEERSEETLSKGPEESVLEFLKEAKDNADDMATLAQYSEERAVNAIFKLFQAALHHEAHAVRSMAVEALAEFGRALSYYDATEGEGEEMLLGEDCGLATMCNVLATGGISSEEVAKVIISLAPGKLRDVLLGKGRAQFDGPVEYMSGLRRLVEGLLASQEGKQALTEAECGPDLVEEATRFFEGNNEQMRKDAVELIAAIWSALPKGVEESAKACKSAIASLKKSMERNELGEYGVEVSLRLMDALRGQESPYARSVYRAIIFAFIEERDEGSGVHARIVDGLGSRLSHEYGEFSPGALAEPLGRQACTSGFLDVEFKHLVPVLVHHSQMEPEKAAALLEALAAHAALDPDAAEVASGHFATLLEKVSTGEGEGIEEAKDAAAGYLVAAIEKRKLGLKAAKPFATTLVSHMSAEVESAKVRALWQLVGGSEADLPSQRKGFSAASGGQGKKAKALAGTKPDAGGGNEVNKGDAERRVHSYHDKHGNGRPNKEKAKELQAAVLKRREREIEELKEKRRRREDEEKRKQQEDERKEKERQQRMRMRRDALANKHRKHMEDESGVSRSQSNVSGQEETSSFKEVDQSAIARKKNRREPTELDSVNQAPIVNPTRDRKPFKLAEQVAKELIQEAADEASAGDPSEKRKVKRSGGQWQEWRQRKEAERKQKEEKERLEREKAWRQDRERVQQRQEELKREWERMRQERQQQQEQDRDEARQKEEEAKQKEKERIKQRQREVKQELQRKKKEKEKEEQEMQERRRHEEEERRRKKRQQEEEERRRREEKKRQVEEYQRKKKEEKQRQEREAREKAPKPPKSPDQAAVDAHIDEMVYAVSRSV